MYASTAERPRDEHRESLERARYRILEFAYLLTGGDRSRTLAPERLLGDLEYPAEAGMRSLEFLIWEDYLCRDVTGSTIRLTEKGFDYVRQNAWRRRSIRG